MPESPGVNFQEQMNKNGENIYQPPEAWKKSILYHKGRIQKAKEMRNNPFRKFDGMTFIADFTSNEDAVNSYLKPKKNDDDVRVVGTTTEKRIESVMNELLSMNSQHEIQAFDKDDAFIRGLGKTMEDVVTRTNQMEKDDDIRVDALWELVTQRIAIIEESVEEWVVGEHVVRQCRKRVRSAMEVFFGDITIPAYQLSKQPYIVIYDRMSLPAARMIYGHFDNFKWVRGGQDLSNDVYGYDVTFRLGILAQEEVEIVKYYSVPDNEFQIYINGVPMYEPGKKMPFQYPFPHYPIAVAIPKRMSHHFLYGRSLASSMKFLQALSDETIRNMIRKFRQAIEPPRATASNDRVYSRDMYVAGKISYGLNIDALKPVVAHDGVTQSEVNIWNLIKQMQDETAARGDTQLGVAPQEKQTATATIEQQKQAIKMLGLLVLAWNGLVRDFTELRLWNVLESLTESEGKEKDPITGELRDGFRRFTLKDQTFENGKQGDKLIQFIGHDLTQSEHEQIAEIEDQQDRIGNPVRIAMLNVKKVKKAPIFWYVTVTSKPKESDDLHRLMFQEKFAQGQNISAVTGRPMNADRVIEEWQRTWREKDWFLKPEQAPGGAQGMAGAAGGDLASQAMAGIQPGGKTNAPPANLRALSGAVESVKP